MVRSGLDFYEDVTEAIVGLERETGQEMNQAFEGYEDALDRFYSALENSDSIDPGDEPSDSFRLFRETGLVTEDGDGYSFSGSEYGLNVVEERLDEYSSRGFDDIELIVRYRLEAGELSKPPSSNDARKSDHMPTANPYTSRYGKWCNAKWRAGFKGHEKMGKDLLLEKLKDGIHKHNEDNPIDEYKIPFSEDLSDIEAAPTGKALRANEEIGSYEDALKMAGFLHLHKEGRIDEEGRWKDKGPDLKNRIEEFFENEPSKGTHFLNTQNYQFIPDLKEVADSDLQNSVRASTIQEGRFYTALEDIGLMESWGEGPRYIVKGSKGDFAEVESQIAEKVEEDEIVSRHVGFTNMLRRAARFHDGTPTMEEISVFPEAPHGGSFGYHIGKYNNAVLMAGLEPNHTEMPENKLDETLLDLYHVLGRRPSKDEVREIGGISPSTYDRRFEDGLEGRMEHLDIPTYEDELDNVFDDIFATRESETPGTSD